MNQVAHTLAFIPQAEKSTEIAIDLSPLRPPAIEQLAAEIQILRNQSEQLTQQNDTLKQLIDSIYASPTEKRQLLEQLEGKYKISRRRACRLLTFARSTCWYRSSTGEGFSNSDKAEINTLSNSALVQRLKKLARQAENGFIPLDENLRSQFEYGLNRIGFQRVALLSQSNLKLAMEIFSTWCEQARQR